MDSLQWHHNAGIAGIMSLGRGSSGNSMMQESEEAEITAASGASSTTLLFLDAGTSRQLLSLSFSHTAGWHWLQCIMVK